MLTNSKHNAYPVLAWCVDLALAADAALPFPITPRDLDLTYCMVLFVARDDDVSAPTEVEQPEEGLGTVCGMVLRSQLIVVLRRKAFGRRQGNHVAAPVLVSN